MRVAAIDVGTNSVHLLVADVSPTGEIQVVEKAREQVELGRGGLENNELTEDAMERGRSAMRSFKEAIDGLEVEAVTAAATSAVREARNGSHFVRSVREQTGIHIKVISGPAEARLIYLGSRADLDFARGYALILDLGGGSAELILCDSSQPLVQRSLPLGHIRLAEAFGDADPPSPKTIKALRAHVRSQLLPLQTEIPSGRFGSFTGTSGSVRTLARMATLARGEQVPTHDHGLILRPNELAKLIRAFTSKKSASYVEIPGMDARRRDTILFAAVMVHESMKVFGASEIVASERSLRDGLLQEWILANQPELALSKTVAWPRMRAVLRTMARYEVDRPHAEHVRDLALRLFDDLQPVHGLDGEARRLLEFGALLHDVGHHIAGESHNRHGQYLIQHTRLPGFTAPQVAMLGNIVRYHRGGRPKKGQATFDALSKSQQRQLQWLAGMLRVADGLDRSHSQPVEQVAVTSSSDELRIDAYTTEQAHLERWAVQRRKRLLERVSGRTVRILVHGQGAAPPDAAA
jgi:exopolyphosphatase/guanosine-5'-triphosphate,3'-diphosphate pyrophosphatase